MRKLKNLTETGVRRLASDLANALKDKDAVIGLAGNLGAGKTTFTKSFARALGVKRAKSPTFIVAAEYPLKKRKLYHIDLYRLGKMDELQTIGLADILESSGRIALIEWIDKFPALKKQCDVLIEFEITGPNTRDVKIHTH